MTSADSVRRARFRAVAQAYAEIDFGYLRESEDWDTLSGDGLAPI